MVDKQNHKNVVNALSSQGAALIIGFGVTGRALADFFENQKIKYYVYDEHQVVSCEGHFFQRGLQSLDEVQKLFGQIINTCFPSPGVALTHPVVQMALQKDVPIIGELELASFYLKGDFIAVTGTNGKSTTVKLINALLKDAGLKASLKGNIGSPLISAVNEPPQSYYVIEESSYQLELIGSMNHKISVCLNVTEDHFDRYANLLDYAAAKANIFKNATKLDIFVFNDDDVICHKMSLQAQARCLPYSLVRHFKEEGGFVKDEALHIKLADKTFIFPLITCSLKGLHNVENMLAALLVVLNVASDEASVVSYRRTLKNFEGLAHRLEKVCESNNVVYYNDSKATNVGAVVMALASFDYPIVLIAGGKDKFCDWGPLKPLVKAKVSHLILLGEAKERLQTSLKDETTVSLVKDMQEAAILARKVAPKGATVLLSPACASFDQYKNYEERGEDFKNQVRAVCQL